MYLSSTAAPSPLRLRKMPFIQGPSKMKPSLFWGIRFLTSRTVMPTGDCFPVPISLYHSRAATVPGLLNTILPCASSNSPPWPHMTGNSQYAEFASLLVRAPKP